MTCRPFMCGSDPACADRLCEGHPANLGDDRLTSPEEMSAAGAFLGLLAIAVLVGLIGFAVYTIAPLVASSI